MRVQNAKSVCNWTKVRHLEKIVFVGKNTVAVGVGSTIAFVDLITGSEKYFTPEKKDGDGVNCISGHQKFDLFAFAEYAVPSKITLLTYPDFIALQRLKNKPGRNVCYLDFKFSEDDYLVALTGTPDFMLQIWNWRSGYLVDEVKTEMTCPFQSLKLHSGPPLTVSQLNIEDGILNFWIIFTAMDRAAILPKKFHMVEEDASQVGFYDLAYHIDGSVFITTRKGLIRQIFPTIEKVVQVYEWKGVAKRQRTHMYLYKEGLIISAPDYNVLYLNKIDGVWTKSWTIEMEFPIIHFDCYNQEYLIGVTRNGILMRLIDDFNSPQFIPVKEYDRFFRDICFIYPLCEFIITVNVFDEIKILLAHSGQRVGFIHINEYTCIKEHPSCPYAIIGDKEGVVHVLSVYEPSSPKILTRLEITSEEIKQICFTDVGHTFAVADVIGNIYIIKGMPGDRFVVENHIETHRWICDFVIFESNNIIYITAVTKEELKDDYKADNLLRIEVLGNAVHMAVKQFDHEYLPCLVCHPTKPMKFYSVPFNSRFIHEYDWTSLRQPDADLQSGKIIKTPHQFKYVMMSCNNDFVLSWSMEGYVCIWDRISMELITCVETTGRYMIIKSAKCDPFRQNIISLSNHGDLVCTSVFPSSYDVQKMNVLRANFNSYTMEDMFLHKETNGFINDLRWVDLQKYRTYEMEKRKCADERQHILDELEEVKAKLKVLIDNNETCPDEERLPIQEFNLHTEHKLTLIENARVERKVEEENLKRFIADQQSQINKIKQLTWDKMVVKGTKLRAINSRLNVENYAKEFESDASKKAYKDVVLWRTIEKRVDGDMFHLWMPYSKEEREALKCKVPEYEETTLEEKESVSSQDLSDSTDGDALSTERMIRLSRSDGNKYSLSGTSSHNFIVPHYLHYEQLDVINRYQTKCEIVLGHYDNLLLRDFFNKKFDAMIETKELEIEAVKRRNDRLRYIQSELNILERLKNSDVVHCDVIIDPDYTPDEKPESIVKVEEYEVPVKPYISPSMQRILDEQAAEAERRRLEMLADDFRERALYAMMWGVLEIRWEDEIKKNPTPPVCILEEKDPKDYADADLKAIKDYEDNLAFLASERERYRNMLEDEKQRLQTTLDDQVIKFNYKVGSLLQTKMQVEAAICEEDFKHLSNNLSNQRRDSYYKKIKELMQLMKLVKSEIDELNVKLDFLESALNKVRLAYENLMNKDRMLEKQFKLNFTEFAPQAVVDQAYRLFRRRQKFVLKAIHTSAILEEMAGRVLSPFKENDIWNSILPKDCIEYLKQCDHRDLFANTPNIIDQKYWTIMCKMRRVKMQQEFQLRKAIVNISEAEGAINSFIKEINWKRQKLINIEHEIENLKECRLNEITNRMVQLVLPRGNIEVPLSGNLSDFDNAVLLHTSDVDDINQIIKKAGQRKIKTMEHAARFRRKIIYKEWEHKLLRMTIEDMQNYMKTIEKVKITKEVQLWLHWKSRGWTEDFSQSALNKEIETAMETYRTSQREIIIKINEVDMQIKKQIKENKSLDKKIQSLNLDVSEQLIQRDVVFEERQERLQNQRMAMIVERARLVREVQRQHAQIIELCTTLELQRLRTYPTLTMHQTQVYGDNS